MLISQVKSGQWWVRGSSSPPSRRTLGKTTQRFVILLHRGDKSLTSWVVELGCGDPVL